MCEFRTLGSVVVVMAVGALLGGQAQGDTFVVPLDAAGPYQMYESVYFDFDLGVELSAVYDVRVDWAGGVRAGVSCDFEPFPWMFELWLPVDGGGYKVASGPEVGLATYPDPEPFAAVSTFRSIAGGYGWDFLLDGAASGWVELAFLLYFPECPPRVFPSGSLEGASLIIDGTPVDPALIHSEPEADGTLPRMGCNAILLTFDGQITLPAEAAPLEIVPLAGGPAVTDQFAFSVMPDGATLCAEEIDPLPNQTWYRLTPAPEFEVMPFVLDVCTLWGDVDLNCRVTTGDNAVVKAHMGETTADPCAYELWDVNCSGRVTTADYAVIKEHMGDRPPPKP